MSVELGSINSEKSHSASADKSSKSPQIIGSHKALFLQSCPQVSLAERDLAWLNPEDYRSLFDKESGPHYIQVANQVFEVAQAALTPGWISICDHHADSIFDAFFTSQNHSMVTVIPFSPLKSPPHQLKKLDIELELDQRYFSEEGQHILQVNEIHRLLSEKLKGKILARKSTYLLSFPWGTLKARITALHPKNNSETISSFGVLDKATEIKLVQNLPKDVCLIDKVITDGIERYDFYVSLDKRAPDTNSNALPLVLRHEELHHLIKEHLGDNLFSEERLIAHSHPSGWDIKIRFKRSVLQEEAFRVSTEANPDYKKGYVFNEQIPIKLEAHHNIIIAGGEPTLVKEITFKISDMPGNQSISIDHDKERWISVQEMRKTLLEMQRPFVSKEIFELRLSSGAFLIEVRKALSDDATPDPEKNIEKLWLIDKNTEIEFEIEKQLELNLIKDEKIREIQRAFFQIYSTKTVEDDLKVTIPELTVCGITQSPKKLVTHQRFTVVRDIGDRFEFKLLRAEFADDTEFNKNLSSFGKWTINTKVEFSIRPVDPLTLIEEIYSEEIECMRFSLRATKQTNISKHLRPPLVLNRDEIIQQIRKELKEHPYIVTGHKITLPSVAGWEIEAFFRKGVLQRDENKSVEEKSLITSQLIKKGFAPLADTTIDLMIAGTDLIVLTQGEPILASRMHLAVTEILEDYTIDDASIIKGAWVNLEELKKEALSLNKSFARGEKILLDLESGRYLVEVRSAKAKSNTVAFPRKRNEASWKIDTETKIEVKVEQKTNLKIVDTDTIYPLKKIKFIATQENSKADHANIKEKELREALLEALPEKLIKGQIITLDTKSNHTIQALVDELQLEDELLNVDKKRIFVKITEDTEVIFRAKENPKKEEKTSIFSMFSEDEPAVANLAINANPKILEVDDPIEYLENLGMGGLDNEFKKVFRIFLSRSDDLREEARRRGTKPIKGMLFYGPPGTGKTTLARHIGEMMGCSGERLQMFTATEMFNMWFGNSEENIRGMFAPARKAQEEYRDKSPLHIIIIDEIDALLPQRGGSSDSVREPLVNQFLGEMDGLKELNNLLVIGITNRKDDIDPAALRHGRLGEHVEIGLPDKRSRRKIFEIHTRKLAKENLLSADFDLDKLADKTDKCPGAAIEGIVEGASLFSLERLSKLKCPKKELRTHPDGTVTMTDFIKAIEDTMKTVKKDGDISESAKSMYV